MAGGAVFGSKVVLVIFAVVRRLIVCSISNFALLYEGFAAVVLTIAGLIFIYNEKLRVHPYPLIGVACLCEGALLFNQFDIRVVCIGYFPWFNIYKRDISWFKYLTISSILDFLETEIFLHDFLQRHLLFFDVYFVLTLMSNALVFYDLAVTVYNPFQSTEVRAKKERFLFWAAAFILWISFELLSNYTDFTSIYN